MKPGVRLESHPLPDIALRHLRRRRHHHHHPEDHRDPFAREIRHGMAVFCAHPFCFGPFFPPTSSRPDQSVFDYCSGRTITSALFLPPLSAGKCNELMHKSGRKSSGQRTMKGSALLPGHTWSRASIIGHTVALTNSVQASLISTTNLSNPSDTNGGKAADDSLVTPGHTVAPKHVWTAWPHFSSRSDGRGSREEAFGAISHQIFHDNKKRLLFCPHACQESFKV